LQVFIARKNTGSQHARQALITQQAI